MYPDLFYWDGYRIEPNSSNVFCPIFVKLFCIVIFRGQQRDDFLEFFYSTLFNTALSTALHSTVTEDVSIEPRTVTTLAMSGALTTRLDDRSHPLVILNDHPNLSGMQRYCINLKLKG
jgi:hypothetical protein